MNSGEQTSKVLIHHHPTLVSSSYDHSWKTSPLLPIESMASRQYSLVSLLANAHENQLTLSPLIMAFSKEHRRGFADRLESLAHLLALGNSLSTSLERTPYVLPDETIAAIRFGSETNSLAKVFDQLMETDKPIMDEVSEKWQSTFVFGFLILIATGTIGAGVLYFIVPTFKKMFEELEIRLPAVTVLMISAIRLVPLLLFIFSSAIILAVLCYATPFGLFLRRLHFRSLFGSLSSRAKRSIFRMLALAFRTDLPLADSLGVIASTHPVALIRGRFAKVKRDVDQGNDPWQSLIARRLLSTRQAEGLSTMPDNETRAWALLQIATESQIAERRRAYTAISILQPMVVVILSVFVLWFCVACFVPLTELVHSLAY